MVEWLQTIVVRPIMEIVLLFPVPLRYSILVFLLTMVFVILPLGVVFRIVMLGIRVVLQWVRLLLAGIQGMYAHQRSPSFLLQAFDGVVDTLAMWVNQRIAAINTSTKRPIRGWRPRKWVFLGLILLPVALWAVVPLIQETTLGKTLRNSETHIARFEGWAITGKWQTLERTAPNTATEAQTTVPANTVPTLADAVDTPETTSPVTLNDTIHVVKKGEMLKVIARQYQVKISCIIEENKGRYEKFNADSLRIGMELYIPVNKPDCTT